MRRLSLFGRLKKSSSSKELPKENSTSNPPPATTKTEDENNNDKNETIFQNPDSGIIKPSQLRLSKRTNNSKTTTETAKPPLPIKENKNITGAKNDVWETESNASQRSAGSSASSAPIPWANGSKGLKNSEPKEVKFNGDINSGDGHKILNKKINGCNIW